MAIPFYYNPATNELELTADPSPLRTSVGERFGLNEISTRAKTLSPTKSHIAGAFSSPLPADFDEISVEEMEDIKKQVKFGQQVKDGGRIGFSRGTAMVAFEKNVPLKERAIELLNEGLTKREVAKALESEGLIKYTSFFDKTYNKTLKNYGNIESFFRKLFAAGELDVKEIGKLSKKQIERNAKLLEIIKDNPDFNPGQLADKASIDLKYKITPNVIKLLAKKEGIDVLTSHARIFPEVKHLDELIKNNEKYLSTSIEEVSSSAKRRFLFDEMKKKFGKEYTIDNFQNRLTRVGKIYIKGPGRYEKELYKTIKTPLNYAGSMLHKNMIGLVSKSFLGVISKAEILGLPKDQIKLLRDALKGASALTDGKIKIAGDHTDIDALMKMDFETYKKEFTRINIISYALNSEKLKADQEFIKLVKDFNTGVIKPDEFKKQVETIRTKYKYLEVPLAKPILKEGKVALDYQTPRLIDLANPRNKAILTAAENLVKNPGVIFKDIDQQLLSKNITIQEKFNILKNATLEQLKNSKYLNAFSKMSGKPGKYARALKAGKYTAGAAGLWLLLTAGTTRDDKTKKETLEPSDKKQEAGISGDVAKGLTYGTIGTIAANYPKEVWELAKKAVVKPIAAAALPVVKGVTSAVETGKAIKEKRLPDYDLTDPHTWVNAAFWNWAVKEWGFDKTADKFGQSLKHLSTGDKARVFRNVVARAGLSPKALQFIGSRVAWPVAGAMSVYDAYKDYQRRKPFIEEQKELIEQGVVKEEEFDKEEPMFAMGGIASLMK